MTNRAEKDGISTQRSLRTHKRIRRTAGAKIKVMAGEKGSKKISLPQWRKRTPPGALSLVFKALLLGS